MADERLREHPKDRFAGSEALIHFDEVYEALEQEDHPGLDGHKQIVIQKAGNVTLVAFLFEKDGTLEEHKANGVAVIQALEGTFAVKTKDNDYQLKGPGCVVLEPGVKHSVTAKTPGKVLLTVHLQKSRG